MNFVLHILLLLLLLDIIYYILLLHAHAHKTPARRQRDVILY